jgi:hypothetical protein
MRHEQHIVTMEAVFIEIRDLLKELVERKKAQAIVADNFTCTGTTAKGKPCTNKRIENSEYCGMHGGNKKRKAQDTPTPSTNATIVSSHDHGEEEVTSARDVPTPTDYSIQERLRNILQHE